MNGPDSIQFQRDSRGIDWHELVRLFKLAKMGGREGDRVRRAFENSTVVCFALDGHRLVGAARALSDGEYHATVYDVVVHPEYQRRGVGSTNPEGHEVRLHGIENHEPPSTTRGPPGRRAAAFLG